MAKDIYANQIIENVYSNLKADFEARRKALVGDDNGDGGPLNRFNPAPELKEENSQDIIDGTNNTMADAADNRGREEIRAASKKANVLLSMGRDNHSATRDRLGQIRNYMLYVTRALYEADPEDSKQSDGMLLAGVRRVDL